MISSIKTAIWNWKFLQKFEANRKDIEQFRIDLLAAFIMIVKVLGRGIEK